MDALGKSPIPLPMLILGKLTMAGSWSFFFLKSEDASLLLYDSVLTQMIGILLALVGLVIVVFGFVFLGRSVAVGLPEEYTELKTGGIYRFTRNPIYLGVFLICAGSCIFAIHTLNFLLCATTIAIHHWIVTREEQFLEKRFGQAWVEYRRRVSRYIGQSRGI